MSRNLGMLTSWNPQGLSRPIMGLLYLYSYLLNHSICQSVLLCVCTVSVCVNLSNSYESLSSHTVPDELHSLLTGT